MSELDLSDIPADIHDAADRLNRFFLEKNIRYWQLGDCQSRAIEMLPMAPMIPSDQQERWHKDAMRLAAEFAKAVGNMQFGIDIGSATAQLDQLEAHFRRAFKTNEK